MKDNYNKLLEMISFFNQGFHMEQLISYGFKFIHNSLNLDKSVIYIKRGKYFELKNKIGYDNILEEVISNKNLERISISHGKLLISSFYKYFDLNFIENLEMKMVIPLIVKSELIGMIISNGLINEEFTSQYIEFVEKVNILLNNSISIVKLNVDYKKMSMELDKDIYSLLFVNQSVKMLMSEPDIEKLYDMCVEIIQELTASRITSLGFYDEETKKIVLKAYKNISINEEKIEKFEITNRKNFKPKIIYNLIDDEYELKQIFENLSGFYKVKAKYIILIVKEDIVGFITISDSINNQNYTRSMLEIVQSIVASIYIVIDDAKHLEMMKYKLKKYETQITMLQKINDNIENLQECKSIECLNLLAVEILKTEKNIKNAMLIISIDKSHEITESFDLNLKGKKIKFTERFAEKIKTDEYFYFRKNMISEYFSGDIVNLLIESNCFAIAPIKIDLENRDV